MGMSWTFEYIDTLKELVRMGLSHTEIGLTMNISSAAAAGKIQRLRKETGDDTMRAGLTAGRIGKSHEGGYRQIKRITPEERAARTRERWEQWEQRNPATYRDAIKAAIERRAKMRRKEERKRAMVNLTDFPNRIHLLDRQNTQCPWPLWCEEAPFSEKMMCGNKPESYGHYCAAHMALAHDYRVAGTFVTDKARAANKWTIQTGRRAA